jgi:GT2 family glycosyltransferase
MIQQIHVKVFIVIPTYDRCQDLLACLDSLAKVTGPDFEIIVVDNASQDDTWEKVRTLFPGVILLEAGSNLGATGASNLGFERALHEGADYILRLDSDTVVAPDLLNILLAFGAAHPNSGVLSPKIYYYDQPEVIWYAGAQADHWHYGAVQKYRKVMDSPENSQPIQTEYIWAAAMLIRAEVLARTGGFDTDFLVYHEELDFCRRVRRLGYELWLVPEAKVWHKVGTQVENAWRAYQWNRGKILLYRKHAQNGLHLALLVLYAFAYTFMRAIFKKSGVGNRGPLKDALRGLWDGLRTPISSKIPIQKEQA